MRTLGLFLLLAACAPAATDLPPVGEDLVTSQAAACEARGGRWGAGGGGATFVCYEETRDANRSCATASDCEGFCLARSRSCSPVKPLFGCNDIVNALGATTRICIE